MVPVRGRLPFFYFYSTCISISVPWPPPTPTHPVSFASAGLLFPSPAETPKRLPRGLAAGGSHAALGRARLDPPGRDLTHAAERGPGVGGDLPKTAAREEREAGPVTQRVHEDV